jgi:hypothetical protein
MEDMLFVSSVKRKNERKKEDRRNDNNTIQVFKGISFGVGGGGIVLGFLSLSLSLLGCVAVRTVHKT